MGSKEKLEIIAQKLENKKRRLEIIEAQKDLQFAEKEMVLNQINNLKELITEEVIDEEKTIFASEIKYKKVFSNDEIEKLKKKIWALLETI